MLTTHINILYEVRDLIKYKYSCYMIFNESIFELFVRIANHVLA